MVHIDPSTLLPSTGCSCRRHGRLLHRHPAVGTVVMVALLLTVITFIWPFQRLANAVQEGFDQDCAGFAQDPVLGDLWPWKPGSKERGVSLASMVPRLALRGKALATYAKQNVQQTKTNLEALFGVVPYGQRETVETTFYQEARAVVLYPNVIATVAHALTPDVVEVHVGRHSTVHTVPLYVTEKTLVAHVTRDDRGMPAQIAHINEPYDLALVQVQAHPMLRPLPYATALSYGTGEPRHPMGGLEAGDCVVAVVSPRDDETHATRTDRLVVGKVLAKVPVATNSMTQTKLNVNMFTTDLAVKPGDSGSPVLALQEGKPVLVGVVSATMLPTAMFTYVSRIDPIVALADALRMHTFAPQR